MSAALTGGRSVNPLTGIQQAVSVLTGNRTTEQKQAYDAAQRQLGKARAAVKARQKAEALSILAAIDLGALAPDDAKTVKQQIDEVKASARG